MITMITMIQMLQRTLMIIMLQRIFPTDLCERMIENYVNSLYSRYCYRLAQALASCVRGSRHVEISSQSSSGSQTSSSRWSSRALQTLIFVAPISTWPAPSTKLTSHSPYKVDNTSHSINMRLIPPVHSLWRRPWHSRMDAHDHNDTKNFSNSCVKEW